MITYITAKPILATVTQLTTFTAWVLSLANVINPVLGFLAFIIFLLIQWSTYKKKELEREMQSLENEIKKIRLRTAKEHHPFKLGDE